MFKTISTLHILMLMTASLAGLFIAGLLLVKQAQADGEEPMFSVTGELTYFQRIALPPDAVAIVGIRPEGAPQESVAIAETRIELDGRQVPIAFSLELPRAHLQHDTSYVIAGGILIGAQQRWQTGQPVSLDISSDHFDAGTMVMVQQQEDGPERPSEATGGQEALAGEWQIIRLGPDAIAKDVNATIEFDAEGAFFGRLCNSFRGSYSLDGMSIAFGQTAATLMACPGPQGEQEKILFAAFETAASYQITEEGMLNLLDEKNRILMSAQR